MVFNDYIRVGQIVAPHGLQGEVKVNSYTSDPLAIGGYGTLLCDNKKNILLINLRQSGHHVIGKLELKKDGSSVIEQKIDRNLAESFKGQSLYIHKAVLPVIAETDVFYHNDLAFLSVYDGDDKNIGIVKAVQNYGGNDLLEIELLDKKITYLIFDRSNVKEVNIAQKYIKITPPQGWII